VTIELKLLFGEKQSAGIGRALMKKGKSVGYLMGPAATAGISEPSPVFYLRLIEGKTIEEVVLLALNQTKNRREIDVGASLDKPQFRAQSLRTFEAVEVGLRLFRITPTAPLAKGEYMFLLLGSAEPPKGSYGKVYAFSIIPPSKG
jgi:hypothetical protein